MSDKSRRERQKERQKGTDRLLDLLGDSGSVTPVSFSEARMMAEMAGARIARDVGERMDNECGKMCYSSESKASAAGRRRVNISSSVSRLRVYFCDTCKAWHLTSSFFKI